MTVHLNAIQADQQITNTATTAERIFQGMNFIFGAPVGDQEEEADRGRSPGYGWASLSFASSVLRVAGGLGVRNSRNIWPKVPSVSLMMLFTLGATFWKKKYWA